MTVDRKRCMAPKVEGFAGLGGERCGQPATHQSAIVARLCTTHANLLRERLRNPDTVANVLLGRARTEEEIAKLVVELPS